MLFAWRQYHKERVFLLHIKELNSGEFRLPPSELHSNLYRFGCHAQSLHPMSWFLLISFNICSRHLDAAVAFITPHLYCGSGVCYRSPDGSSLIPCRVPVGSIGWTMKLSITVVRVGLAPWVPAERRNSPWSSSAGLQLIPSNGVHDTRLEL